MRTLRNLRCSSDFGTFHGGMEALEPRTHLSGGVGPQPANAALARFFPSTLQWHGIRLDNWSQGSWIVQFKGEQPQAQAEARARQVASALGVNVSEVQTTLLGKFARIQTSDRITEAAIANVKGAFGFLANVEPDLLRDVNRVPNDALYGSQWPHKNTGQNVGGPELADGFGSGAGTANADIKTEQAWNVTTGSDQVVVGVLDTGVDYTHPDLRDNMWRNPGEIAGNNVDDDGDGLVDDVYGYDFVGANGSGDSDPFDPPTQGHGTGVAGIIGAKGNNAIGVAGVNWNVKILALKFFGDTGLGNTFASIQAFNYAVVLKRRGVNLVAINGSYGSIQDAQTAVFNTAEQTAIQDLTDSGVLFVASAGNDGLDNDASNRAYPASYDNPFIISVAATDNKDNLAVWSGPGSSSSYGATTVDIGAPGKDCPSTATGGGYWWFAGTSCAAPYTAGVIALMASVNKFADKSALKAGLFGSADPLPSLTGRVATGARINAFNAVRASRVEGLFVTAVSPGTQAANVTKIEVEFSGDVDPAFFAASKVVLKKANGASAFTGQETDVSLAGATITLSGRKLTIDLGATALPRDLYRLILRNDGFRDLQGNRLNGDQTQGNDDVYDFNVIAFRGPFEPNDTIATATPIILAGNNHALMEDLYIGDGIQPTSDVDMFRVYVSGPSLLTIDVLARRLPVASTLDTYVRLFSSAGQELAKNDNYEGLDSRMQFFVPGAGDYYIAVSAYPNSDYVPSSTNGRKSGGSTGDYALDVQVLTSGPETVTKTGAGTPVAIPVTGEITSTINVTDGRSISDLVVRLNVTHTFVSDLKVTLVGPDGTQVVLFNRRGGSGRNLTNTVFSDAGTVAIGAAVAPFTGTFRPEAELTPFKNRSALGTWTLKIQDLKALDSGSLVFWSIDFTHVNDITGQFELNDTVLLATDLGINGAGSRTVEATIGDGAFGLRDVDLYRFVAGAGTTVTASATPSKTATAKLVLRLFDSQGREVRADRRHRVTDSLVNFVVANAGTYYLGVSGGSNSDNASDTGNDRYDPALGGSGAPTDGTGQYTLSVSVSGGVSEGPRTLTGDRLSLGVGANGTIGLQQGTGLKLDGLEFLLGNGNISSYFSAIYDTGFIVRNAGDGSQTDVPMSLASESDAANRRAVATGLYRSLGVRRAVSFGVGDQSIAIDVTLTNRSENVINNLAWLEGFGARQGLNIPDADPLTADQTVNNIDNATHRLATSRFGNYTLGLAVPTPRQGVSVVTTFAGTGVARDPVQVLNNAADPDPSGADAGVPGTQDMVVGVNLGSLSPAQSVTFRYFLLLGNTPAEVAQMFAKIENGTGKGHLVGDPTSATPAGADLPYAVYYPEGYANDRASTFLPIVNAQAEGARVVVIAHYEKSSAFNLPVSEVLYDSATDEPNHVIAPGSRAGITLTTPTLYAQGTAGNASLPGRVKSQIPGRNGVFKDTPYALEIRSSAPVGATLSHYDFGITTGQAAISRTAPTWTFAQVQKGAGMNDFVVFQNPGDTTVKVTLTFFGANGAVAGGSFTQNLEAGRRGGWSIAALPVPNGTYSIRLDAEGPIVAALTHFDSAARTGFGTTGLPGAGATSGGTAQGQIGLAGTSEIVSVFNPSGTQATVTVNFAFANASAYRRTLTVPAFTRKQLNVAKLAGFPRGQAYSVTYTSDVPVTVNLPSQTSVGASGATLTDQASTQWLFAEGFRPSSGSAVKEYLRIYNPSLNDTTVEIQMNFNDGSSEVFRRTVAGRSTADFNVFDFVTGTKAFPGTSPGTGSFYGVRVISATPIVAFTGHYDGFLGGGFGYLGTPLGTTGTPA